MISLAEKADILAFVARFEFYSCTAHHWGVALPDTTRNRAWWASRAALDDVFGGTATDLDATRVSESDRILSKKSFTRAVARQRRGERAGQSWRCTFNMVPWSDIKQLAYGEFQGGKPSLWARAFSCRPGKIDMKRTGPLIDRMIRLTALVAGEPPASAGEDRGPGAERRWLGAAFEKDGKGVSSTVSVNEVWMGGVE